MNRSRSSQTTAVLVIGDLVLIWGYNWVATKVAVRYSSAIDFAAWRVLLGVLVLLRLVILFRRLCLPRENTFATFLTGLSRRAHFMLSRHGPEAVGSARPLC